MVRNFSDSEAFLITEKFLSKLRKNFQILKEFLHNGRMFSSKQKGIFLKSQQTQK